MVNDQLQELLKKFKDGNERYIKDPRFHATIDLILSGGDKDMIIDNLLTKLFEINEDLTELLKKVSPKPAITILKAELPEGFDKEKFKREWGEGLVNMSRYTSSTTFGEELE